MKSAFRALITLGTIAVAHPPAGAEGRWYAGVTASDFRVGGDDVDAQGTSSLGALAGVRLTRHVSLELEHGRGLGDLSWTFQGDLLQLPVETPQGTEWRMVTLERRDRWNPTGVWAVRLVVSSPKARLRVAGSIGCETTTYEESVEYSVVRIAPGIQATEREILSMFHPAERRRARIGVAASVMVPVSLTRAISVAPEIAYTFPSLGYGRNPPTTIGVRVLWAF